MHLLYVVRRVLWKADRKSRQRSPTSAAEQRETEAPAILCNVKAVYSFLNLVIADAGLQSRG